MRARRYTPWRGALLLLALLTGCEDAGAPGPGAVPERISILQTRTDPKQPSSQRRLTVTGGIGPLVATTIRSPDLIERTLTYRGLVPLRQEITDYLDHLQRWIVVDPAAVEALFPLEPDSEHTLPVKIQVGQTLARTRQIQLPPAREGALVIRIRPAETMNIDGQEMNVVPVWMDIQTEGKSDGLSRTLYYQPELGLALAEIVAGKDGPIVLVPLRIERAAAATAPGARR